MAQMQVKFRLDWDQTLIMESADFKLFADIMSRAKLVSRYYLKDKGEFHVLNNHGAEVEGNLVTSKLVLYSEKDFERIKEEPMLEKKD